MFKRVLYCTTNDQYFRGFRSWSPPVLEYSKVVGKAARYSFSKNDDHAIQTVVEAGCELGLTFEVKQVKVIPASIELV